MNDEAIQIASPEERDLVARLIRMGVIAPMILDGITRDQVEEITAALPTVYECRYTVFDQEHQEHVILCSDLTPEAVNRQFFREMSGKTMSSFPSQSLETSYSPEAWIAYLNQDFERIESDTLRERFAQWGVPLNPEHLKDGFNPNMEENLSIANEMLSETQTELFCRLIATEAVEPFDPEHISKFDADYRINGLPALLCSEYIWKDGDEFRRAKFYNVAEFNIKEVQHVEDNEFGYYDDQEITGMNEEVTRSSSATLRMQERKFFDERGIEAEDIVHHSETITGKYDWLNFFKQDISSALPDGRTTALKKTFKNWGFEAKKTSFERAFEPDIKQVFACARQIYQKALISKVVSAGIVPPMPYAAWKNFSSEVGEKFIAGIPLLPEMEHPGEWLDFFRQKTPMSALERVQLQTRFEEIGIPYDEKLILAAFPVKESKSKVQKGFRTMQDLTVDDYKKMMGRLTATGRLERMDKDTWDSLTLEDARDYVRGFDEPASQKQQLLITTMSEENRIDIDMNEIGNLSKMEASFIIDNAPEIAIQRDVPANPITDETRRELKSLMDKNEIPRIPYAQWKNLSEEEGRQKIDHAYARRPASEKQKDFITRALNENAFSKNVLKTFFKSPTISAKEVEALNFLQATKLIGSLPATDKQIDAVKNLVAEKRIEPLESYKLTSAEASRILDKAYRDPAERDPNGPASANQKEALTKLVEAHAIPEMSQKQIENLTFAEAGKLLESAPATRAQKNMIARFVQEDKLSRIPNEEFSSMTRAEASRLIDIGMEKLPRSEQKITPASEIPASDAQKKVLAELREKGKIQEIPDNVSKEMASQMIKDAVANDPISPSQMTIIEKRIANHQIPPMTPEQKAKLTQKDFAEIMKVQPKAPTHSSPADSKELSKVPERAR